MPTHRKPTTTDPPADPKQEARRARDRKLRKLQALRRKARLAAAMGVPFDGVLHTPLETVSGINGNESAGSVGSKEQETR